jgi:ribosomal protein S18 acetylase RimI-like enzyme
MTLNIRRLGPGDEPILELLARDEEDFDLDDRGEPTRPLAPDDARAYLADANVLHWIAERDGVIAGHLYCHVLRKRAGDARELVLYEIGVRAALRRHGVGRALVDAMFAWMREHAIREAWVLADNAGAVEFYRACGFAVGEPAPVYLTA